MKFVGVLEELFGARCKQMQPAFAAFTLDECGNERCDVGSIRIIRAFGIGVHYSISGAYNGRFLRHPSLAEPKDVESPRIVPSERGLSKKRGCAAGLA